MLGGPERFESALLQRPAELRGPHRVVREEDRRSELHRRLLSLRGSRPALHSLPRTARAHGYGRHGAFGVPSDLCRGSACRAFGTLPRQRLSCTAHRSYVQRWSSGLDIADARVPGWRLARDIFRGVGMTDFDAALAGFAVLDEAALARPWTFRDKPMDVRYALYRTLEDAQEGLVNRKRVVEGKRGRR